MLSLNCSKEMERENPKSKQRRETHNRGTKKGKTADFSSESMPERRQRRVLRTLVSQHAGMG